MDGWHVPATGCVPRVADLCVSLWWTGIYTKEESTGERTRTKDTANLSTRGRSISFLSNHKDRDGDPQLIPEK